MIKQRSSDDGSDIFYECVWDVTILEYIIYAHDKRGEEEKKKAEDSSQKTNRRKTI